jgi:hypothetical protein
MKPNCDGASGNYFYTQLKISHGVEVNYTTKVKLTVPVGVLLEISYTFREIEPYISHGVEVSSRLLQPSHGLQYARGMKLHSNAIVLLVVGLQTMK